MDRADLGPPASRPTGAGPTTTTSSRRGTTGARCSGPTTGCAAVRRGSSSGRAPTAIRAPRRCRPTCGSITCTSSAASTCPRCCTTRRPGRCSSATCRRTPGSIRTGLVRHRRRGGAPAPLPTGPGPFGGGLDLPERVGAMTKAQRRTLSAQIPRDWPAECVDAYRELAVTTSERSADRWRSRLGSDRERAAMVWRLLRLATGAVLRPRHRRPGRRCGSASRRRGTGERPTSCGRFEVVADGTGQARLSWTAAVRERGTANDVDVDGTRRDPLEPRSVRRAPRGEGVPRHAPRPGPRLLPAGVTNVSGAGGSPNHAPPGGIGAGHLKIPLPPGDRPDCATARSL